MKQLLARKYFSGNNISQKILQSNTALCLTFLQITTHREKYLFNIEPSNISHIPSNHYFPGNTQ